MIQTILTVGAVVTSLGTIVGVFIAFYKIVKRFERQETAGECRKEESTILIRSSLAMLDGLTQLGANGPVTKAKNDLMEYITQRGD